MKFFKIMRPAHWTKNVFIFAALIFGKKLIAPVDQVLLDVASSMGAFFCFSIAASSIYIFNDIIDRKADSLHPEKSKRPIAAGTVLLTNAVIMSVFCAVIAVIASFFLAQSFGVLIAGYILLMVFYSLFFKNAIILDCIIIAIGFCLRAMAGAIVIGVNISPWLIICTFAISLFLGFSKRDSEVIALGDRKELFRTTLAGYTPQLLAHMLNVTSGLAIVCFLLYAMDERTFLLFGTNNLVYTTPFVLYCIFRFSALIQKGIYAGPVEVILKDLPFQAGALLWVLACISIVYSEKIGGLLNSIVTY